MLECNEKESISMKCLSSTKCFAAVIFNSYFFPTSLVQERNFFNIKNLSISFPYRSVNWFLLNGNIDDVRLDGSELNK